MSDITPNTIADRLQTLAAQMLDTAAEMDYFGGFSAIGQLGKTLSITAMRAQSCADDIREDYPAEAAATPEQPTDRAALQAAGTHPAPCARHCESNAYQIEIRRVSAERDALTAKLAELEGQKPVAWVEVVSTHEGPYNFEGMALLGKGTHYLYARPVLADQTYDALDAKRYRALRRGQAWSVIDGIGDTLRGEALDAAIDAREPMNDRPRTKGD